jgi:hypothetical protein
MPCRLLTRFAFHFGFVLFLVLPAIAQRIEGRVTDAASGLALPFSTVFINNTSFATEADSTGRFVLIRIPSGSYRLIARLVGYESLSQSIVVEAGKITRVNFALVADKNMLNEVTAKAKRDKTWEANLKQFTRYLLGTDAAARQCKIMNPWVLDLQEENGVLTARTSQPIDIENRHLGYQLMYLLQSFRASATAVDFSGYAQFTPLWAGKSGEQLQWDQQKRDAFRDSDLYLLQSIVQGRAEANGFEAYIDKPGSNPGNRSTIFYNDQAKKLQRIGLDTLAIRQPNSSLFRVILPRRFELHSTKAEGPFAIYRDKPCPLSWIETTAPLLVNEQGLVLNPQAWSVSGFLASRRLAVMLPLDYRPAETDLPAAHTQPLSNRWANRVETPFFVTNKPYYAPKEVVRVSGIMQYANPVHQDSLSRLLHLNLLNPVTGATILSQNVPIEQGLFQTAFVLPDSLPTQPFLLQIYTNWMRNWGDSAVAYRWLPVVPFLQKPVGMAPPDADNLEVSVGDSTIQVRIQDAAVGQFRWVAASLVDTTVVSQLDLPVAFGFPAPSILSTPAFAIERGIGLSGEVANRKGNPSDGTQVLLVVPKTKASFMATSDSAGQFSFTDLPLTGREPILLKATTSRGKAVDRVTLRSETAPALTGFARTLPSRAFQRTIVPSWYGDLSRVRMEDGTVRLAEVLVKAPKKPIPPATKYGEADYVIQGKDIFDKAVGDNILVALQGRVPGLRVVERFGEDGIRKLIITLRGGFTGGGFQQSAPTQPLLLVDGVPFSDVNDLTAISPSRVERIEVVNRAASMMGLRGYLGVIAVYTKQMSDKDTQALQDDPAIHRFTVQGWASDSAITSSHEDVYWQPLAIDRGSFWELSFPKPGRQGTYRLVCEGITTTGKRLVLTRKITL